MRSFYVLSGEGVAYSTPYSQHADARAFLGLLLDVEDNPIGACPPAVQYMPQWAAQFVGFGDNRTAGGHVGKCPDGRKQAGEPAGRAGRGHLAAVLKSRGGVGFGSAGEANRVDHISLHLSENLLSRF